MEQQEDGSKKHIDTAMIMYVICDHKSRNNTKQHSVDFSFASYYFVITIIIAIIAIK
jgi:hypothetical protein